MAKRSERFDVKALRKLAGDKFFARGEAYFHDGVVEIRRQNANEVRAVVCGTDDYDTIVLDSGKDIDGECSCPAFEDWGFCKHLVAVALAVNAKAPAVQGGGKACAGNQRIADIAEIL